MKQAHFRTESIDHAWTSAASSGIIRTGTRLRKLFLSPFPSCFMPRVQWCVFRLGIRVAISVHLRHGGSSEAVPPTSILVGETGMPCMSSNQLIFAMHIISKAIAYRMRAAPEQPYKVAKIALETVVDGRHCESYLGVHHVLRRTSRLIWSGRGDISLAWSISAFGGTEGKGPGDPRGKKTCP
ncbi:hypothetical protein LZ30DRAFT_300540 [Colletotrichum cereale]|nr:hypothetical protein LZ30DRAFT_300540 [Colletotrichum cereale]